MSVFLAVSEIVQVVVFVPLKLLSLSLIVGIVSVYVCIARCVGVRSARGREGERERGKGIVWWLRCPGPTVTGGFIIRGPTQFIALGVAGTT